MGDIEWQRGRSTVEGAFWAGHFLLQFSPTPPPIAELHLHKSTCICNPMGRRQQQMEIWNGNILPKPFFPRVSGACCRNKHISVTSWEKVTGGRQGKIEHKEESRTPPTAFNNTARGDSLKGSSGRERGEKSSACATAAKCMADCKPWIGLISNTLWYLKGICIFRHSVKHLLPISLINQTHCQ